MTSTSFNVGMSLDRSSSKTNKKNDSAPSSSDSESDEDYVPSSKELKDEGNASADENSADSDLSEDDTAATASSGKRKRNHDRGRKKSKIEHEESSDEPKSTKNIDDIWKDFKSDVENERKQKEKIDPDESAKSEQTAEEPKTKTITELFEFAGEAVTVQKEVPADTPIPKIIPSSSGPRKSAGGLSSILGQIGKKNKLSILEKSKLDWNTFKQQEGIEEQLQTHNKGKNGFLEKQDFLQRADLRRFEIEKAMRSSSRRSK